MTFLDNLLNQADICVITEHCLYPDSLALLESVHPDFYGWGRASSDLNLDSEDAAVSGFFGEKV